MGSEAGAADDGVEVEVVGGGGGGCSERPRVDDGQAVDLGVEPPRAAGGDGVLAVSLVEEVAVLGHELAEGEVRAGEGKLGAVTASAADERGVYQVVDALLHDEALEVAVPGRPERLAERDGGVEEPEHRPRGARAHGDGLDARQRELVQRLAKGRRLLDRDDRGGGVGARVLEAHHRRRLLGVQHVRDRQGIERGLGLGRVRHVRGDERARARSSVTASNAVVAFRRPRRPLRENELLRNSVVRDETSSDASNARPRTQATVASIHPCIRGHTSSVV